MDKNAVGFGADMSFSVHIDNKNKDILILSKGLDDTTLTAEAKYSTNFSWSYKKFCLKVVSATFLLVSLVFLKERTCETRKNVFYFTSKALFVLEIIKF